jgi:hypothetical protein
MVIEPTRAGLSPEQVRRFVREVMATYQDISADGEAPADPADDHPR